MSTPTDFATAVQDFISVILSSITNPSDAVKAFAQLADFPQPTTVSTASIGLAQNVLQSGMTDLCRRAAICGLAQASAYYQPSSYDDAENLRTNICAIIDSEILIAGDQGQDQTYLALKSLRALVVQDLTSRGASLARIVTVDVKASLPALAVAYRLYQDIGRTDQVVSFSDPIHPAFMPVSFPALSS